MVFGLTRKKKEIDVAQVTEKVIDTLKEIYDPEIPVNIYELGLIYEVNVNPEGEAKIKMTLTTPACPVAQTFPITIEKKITEVEGIVDCVVVVVWDPPWTTDKMTEAAKLACGLL